MSEPKIYCTHCKKEITEDDKRLGYYAGDKNAYCMGNIFETKPSHGKCGNRAMLYRILTGKESLAALDQWSWHVDFELQQN